MDIQIIWASDILPLLGEGFPETGAICDLLICPDINAALSAGLAANGVLYKYVPFDMADQIIPAQNDDILGFMVEGAQLFYNSEAFKVPMQESGFWTLDKQHYLENNGWIMDWWSALRGVDSAH